VGVSPPKLGGVAARKKISSSFRADGVVPKPKNFKNAFRNVSGSEPPRLRLRRSHPA
jgi:hypothetical protein